ncbi:SMP-30/gluconolactonase/LRE family protein [Skermanella pratensis]|uniref:SMP-30/gluconolactonase/LRE family protein n=1 Tax=Skermanella pratensis TaxID=2233999 RepID=UPI0013017AE4|nr:SMP-30/gluconolactonase/LRE family protein [Skermanella pratensis]
MEVECVLDAKALLGECPVWSVEEQALYWVDILAPALHRLDPATGATRTWAMPHSIGSFGLRESGGAIVALRNGFHLFNFGTGDLTPVANPEPDMAGNRLNDGKAAPDGSFWAGTMDEETMSRRTGSLYRVAPDGTVRRMLDGLIVSNGLAWSADGRTLFHSDSKGKLICAYDHEPGTGDLTNRRVIAEPSEEVGRPDGAATDMEGFYWSAGISAGVLNRWSPDGGLDRQIPMPCAAPTMPCFGGPDMRTIYVTSLRHNVSDERLAAFPLSGGIFALEVDVPGVPVAKFKG